MNRFVRMAKSKEKKATDANTPQNMELTEIPKRMETKIVIGKIPIKYAVLKMISVNSAIGL